jgi:hypothetical protein
MIRRPIEATAELARIFGLPLGANRFRPMKWSWPSNHIGGYASRPGWRQCRLYDADTTLNNFTCNQFRF